jgi:hypothetical protein
MVIILFIIINIINNTELHLADLSTIIEDDTPEVNHDNNKDITVCSSLSGAVVKLKRKIY